MVTAFGLLLICSPPIQSSVTSFLFRFFNGALMAGGGTTEVTFVVDHIFQRKEPMFLLPISKQSLERICWDVRRKLVQA